MSEKFFNLTEPPSFHSGWQLMSHAGSGEKLWILSINEHNLEWATAMLPADSHCSVEEMLIWGLRSIWLEAKTHRYKPVFPQPIWHPQSITVGQAKQHDKFKDILLFGIHHPSGCDYEVWRHWISTGESYQWQIKANSETSDLPQPWPSCGGLVKEGERYSRTRHFSKIFTRGDGLDLGGKLEDDTLVWRWPDIPQTEYVKVIDAVGKITESQEEISSGFITLYVGGRRTHYNLNETILVMKDKFTK